MSKHHFYRFGWIGIVLLALAWTGCDSNEVDEEGQTDADVFVGTWNVKELFINNDDVSAFVLAQFDEVSARFDGNGLDDDGAFSGVMVQEDGERNELVARYELDEEAGGENKGTVTFTGDAFEAPAELSYTIESDNEIVLESDDEAFLAAFAGGADLSAFGEINSVRIVLTR